MSPLSLLAPPLPARLQMDAPAELLQRARAGDRDAIAVLYARFRDRMISLAFGIVRERAEAEDCAQEILLRAFDKMPVLNSESEFAAWLYRLAINYCLDRKRKLDRRHSISHVAPDAQPQRSFDAQVETRLALERVLDELSESARLTLMLREWHELNYDEIAAITGVPVGTVKSRLNNARREFRRIWEAHHAE